VPVCLEQGADLHVTQLMPLPLTVSFFSKIQIGFTFPVPAHLGSPGKRAVKRVCVCVCTTLVGNCRSFSDINIPQGSVATHMRCSGILNKSFAANLLENLTLKKNLKCWLELTDLQQ